jgi:hypothetical protein
MNQRRQPTSTTIPSDLAVFRPAADSAQRPQARNFAPGSSLVDGRLRARAGTITSGGRTMFLSDGLRRGILLAGPSSERNCPPCRHSCLLVLAATRRW